MSEPILKITGEVEYARELTFDDLAALSMEYQIDDVSQIAEGRVGSAVTLEGLLTLVALKMDAEYLGLHASADDFHASIPLEPVLERALIIYAYHGEPLAPEAGGPVRFFIPDYAACHTDEIDECANVKFVDHIELTRTKGFDNRPQDEAAHAELHREEESV